ncbi:MAG: type II secretion system F family protein [Alphaproteobacteria bacterium]|nr:type II secretion system F family protein [Alphaproteobacteria bacterium]
MFAAIGRAIGNPFGDGAIVPLLIGFAAFVAVFIVWYGLLQPRQVVSRIKNIKERREQMEMAQAGTASSSRSTGHPLRDQGLGMANDLVQKLKLFQGTQSQTIAESLAQAGWRSRDAVIFFLAARAAMPIIFAFVAFMMVYIGGMFDLPSMMKLITVVGAAAAGFYSPRIYVTNETQKRQKKLQKAMPDGLDLMVICAEAGLSLDATLNRVARELKTTWPELADEYGHTSIEISFLPERRQALENLTKRVTLPHMRALVNSLLQTERYGTPLAQALRVLAKEMRINRLMIAEEKAARLPAILTVPMILFILPALFVVLIGPAVLRVIDQMRAITS